MKKLIITCALLTSASMLSFAQSAQTSPAQAQPNAAAPQMQNRQRPTPEQMAERRANAAKTQYALNDEQYKGIYAAELDFFSQMQAARANGQQPAPGQAQQMSMAKDAKYKTIMTPEQYQKYSATRRPQPQAAPNNTPPANK
jgi:hypothetical protein